MDSFAQLFSKFIRLLFLVYMCSSAIYTAMRLVSSSTAAENSSHSSSPYESRLAKRFRFGETKKQIPLMKMNDNFLLSKLFQGAMKPTDIRPFYFKAAREIAASEITIVTIIDESRFERLMTLAKVYQGPISVTIHVMDDFGKERMLEKLARLWSQEPLLQLVVDAHVVIDRFNRQFNYWRNVARFFARSDYILLLDVDFIPCTDFSIRLRSPEILRRLESGLVAFVLPAFEYLPNYRNTSYTNFPRDKNALMAAVEQGTIAEFHKGWSRGHTPTNYLRWYKSIEPYEVEDSDYNHSYEPYIVVKKDVAPWCDERFVGYGANKAACLYEFHLSGVQFHVLPSEFLIHQYHLYPEEERKIERKYNRRLFDHFREEICVRYNRMANTESTSPGGEKVPDKRNCTRFLRGVIDRKAAAGSSSSATAPLSRAAPRLRLHGPPR